MGLNTFLDYLDKNEDEAVFSLVIDMFPVSLGIAERYSAGDNPLNYCTLFDNNYHFYGQVHCPYINVFGGFRERMFFADRAADNLVKTPILRADRGIRLLNSSHAVTPAKVSLVRGALLHHKFLGQYRDRIHSEVVRGEHAGGARAYKIYDQKLALLADSKRLIGPNTVSYENSNQLISMGLIGQDSSTLS